MDKRSNIIFVDCEAYGGSPLTGRLTEFGAVAFYDKSTFHGVILNSSPSEENPSIPNPIDSISDEEYYKIAKQVILAFRTWLTNTVDGQPVFVSDNVAFDWQWINCLFHITLGENPFGHSGRRISDFYAGLKGDWRKTQEWKKWRITKHDHNPVNDAMGNLEAFQRILLELT